MKILWIDDDHPYLFGAKKVFERLFNFELVCCATVQEGVSKYNAEYFDAIILDRNAPRGDILWPPDLAKDDSPQGTGEALLRHLRKKDHMVDIPVVIWTQYDSDEFQDQIDQVDSRVRVFSKNIRAARIAEAVVELIRLYPQRRAPIVGDLYDDYRVALYYVADLEKGRRVRVQFECSHRTKSLIEGGDWSLGEFFLHIVSDFPTKIESVVSPLNEVVPECLGIYYDGGIMPNWRHYVMFETWSGTSHQVAQRRYGGVGKAMVVRFLRQCMKETGFAERDLLLDQAKFSEANPELYATGRVEEFLIRIGFEATSEGNILCIRHKQAVKLINEVSTP